MSKRKQNTTPVAHSEEFTEGRNIENVIFIDDSDLLCPEIDAPDEETEADRNRLFWRLKNPKFIAWLKTEGYDQDKATSRMVNEFDELDMARIRKICAKPLSPPAPKVKHFDPYTLGEEEWTLGVDQWMIEGCEDLSPMTERPQWDALVRRSRARLKAEQEKKSERSRQLAIQSLKPPKPGEATGNGKNILDAEQAYQKRRQEVCALWDLRFKELPHVVAQAWKLYHELDGDGFETFVLLKDRKPNADEFPDDLKSIETGLAHPEYEKFQRYNAAVLQELAALEMNIERALNPPPGSRPSLKAWSLGEIDENVGSEWPVPGVIPRGLTFLYGSPKSGKSLWMQKLSVCIAGGVPFDGIEDLEHGRVLYITCDIGASRHEVKKRLIKISARLGLSENALDGKLLLTDDPLHLDDPASVDNLLAQNPGPFTLVVIDSLFRCVSGSLTQDGVASAAAGAFSKISRATGAGVVAIHHEPRSCEQLFGSIMLDATYDAKLHVERGKDRNSVTVSVQELKNAPISDEAFTYQIEGEYLAPIAGVGAAPAIPTMPVSARHQDMLALLPAGWVTRKDGRKLVDHLLTGGPEARRKQWQRAIAAMQTDGKIEVKKNSMRKT